MENNNIERKKTPDNLKHVLNIMRTTLFFLFCSIFFLSASENYAQTINLDSKSASIKEFCRDIENKSDFIFVFSDIANEKISKKVNVNETSSEIKEILNTIFANSGLTYSILENQIVVYELLSESLENVKNKSVATISQQAIKVRGKVVDQFGDELPGVTITVLGSARGVISDNDGNYEIEVEPNDQLVFSFIGLESQTVEVGGRTSINVTMLEKVSELDEITIVAFGTQKKESVVSSISTVRPTELKVPSSNLTTALAGRVPGLISYQRSGEPGQDDASFFVRGVTSFSYTASPLILIDGVEMTSNDLARLQPDDIASFSIMKDALATSLYGARGANGVIIVTTKGGVEGAAKISVRYETSISSPTKNIDFADPVTYMRLNNEAVLTRNPTYQTPYSLSKIDNTELGNNPLVYPANDWQDIMFRDYAINHRFNFNVSGGGKIARYYIAGTYNQDNGILKVDKKNNFNNNIDVRRYQLRTNVDIDVSSTTKAVIRMHGTFEDYNGPMYSGTQLYQSVMRSDPVLFPAYFPPTEETAHVQHILFGNYDLGQYQNPYADMTRGYKESSKSQMMAQFEMKQDLDFMLEGLNARALLSINRYSFFDVQRYYNPFYYMVGSYDRPSDKYHLVNLNPTSGTEYLNYREGTKDVAATTYAEFAIDYNNTFNDLHTISGLLVGTRRNYLEGNAGSLLLSLPSRNVGMSGRMSYSFDSRYFTEFTFGYNGSERFAKKERFGFFPSIGLAWIASNESFMSNYDKKITNLKLKATYGIVGSDAIGDAQNRFFYLSQVDMNASSRGYTFGQEFDYSVNGVSISRYANDKITWETSKKLNLGVEIGLFDKLDFMADYYFERRSNILMTRADIPSTMGLHSTPRANVGEAIGNGIDLSLDYNHAFRNGLWMMGRLNFTYATSEYSKYEEVDNSSTPWLTREGQKIGQTWGYVAERFFVDEQEVHNSPTQTFGEYMGGDLKYRDINNDGQITQLDRVPIGYPVHPEIIYGFGVSMGYEGFDFSCFFQGLGRESFWINPQSTAPFVDTDGVASTVSKNALLKVYADNHWSEANRNLYALWPRLSSRIIDNNIQTSTWFMRDGSFLRLKAVEFGYTFQSAQLKTTGVDNIRIYYSGTNLLTWSKFKLWDPEMAGNGLGYPVQKVHNIGLQISF